MNVLANSSADGHQPQTTHASIFQGQECGYQGAEGLDESAMAIAEAS